MIPDEAVEAAARASYELDHDGIAPSYDECSEGTKRQLHREALVVLEAAAPHMFDEFAEFVENNYPAPSSGALKRLNPYRKDAL